MKRPLTPEVREALKRKALSARDAKRRAKRIAADTDWSVRVRVRDRYTCQRCGLRDRANNEAHHVATRSRRPDLKYALSNGKTICRPCHNWIHTHPIEAAEQGFLSTETYESANGAENNGN